MNDLEAEGWQRSRWRCVASNGEIRAESGDEAEVRRIAEEEGNNVQCMWVRFQRQWVDDRKP